MRVDTWSHELHRSNGSEASAQLWSSKPGNVRLIGQEWPVIKRITDTPHQVMAALRYFPHSLYIWGQEIWIDCMLPGAVLRSAREQGHISHHCQSFGRIPHIWGLSPPDQVCQIICVFLLSCQGSFLELPLSLWILKLHRHKMIN